MINIKWIWKDYKESDMDEFLNVFLGRAIKAELRKASEKYGRSMSEITRQALVHFFCHPPCVISLMGQTEPRPQEAPDAE